MYPYLRLSAATARERLRACAFKKTFKDEYNKYQEADAVWAQEGDCGTTWGLDNLRIEFEFWTNWFTL
jgi:hypothetical protein